MTFFDLTAEWRTHAACAGAWELFDPPRSGRDTEEARILAATTVCRRCDVTDACLASAILHHDYGVRGGVLLAHGRPVPMPPMQRRRKKGRTA